MFDRVVIVDWSASSRPSAARPVVDAIWIGVAEARGVTAQYVRTRAAAEASLSGLLAQGRVLVGFDFAMGYPAGFAQALTGQARAAAVWAWLAARISDGSDNANNRFAVAAEVNRGFGGGGSYLGGPYLGGPYLGGPFWGCPAGTDLPGLAPTKPVDYAALGLAERRLVEQLVPRAQPVWKLYTTGSVGSQSLMGLPVVHRLARAGAAVWPFCDAADARVVVAEVYPSLLNGPVARAGGIKDEAQVRLLALALWRLARSGGLEALLAVPQGVARTEEGWILGAGHADALEAVL